jgi:hypothetical protein
MSARWRFIYAAYPGPRPGWVDAAVVRQIIRIRPALSPLNRASISVETPEGTMTGVDGDWVVRGGDGSLSLVHALETPMTDTEAKFIEWLERFNHSMEQFRELRPRAVSHLQLEKEVREAQRDLRVAIEVIAKGIYDQWANDTAQPKGWVPWVDWGNSLKQDEARGAARKLIEDTRRTTL